MKLNGVQAQMLFQIAIDTLNIHGNIGGMYPDKRLELVNRILSQQGQTLVDTDQELPQNVIVPCEQPQ